MSAIVVGVDGGGTRTRVMVADESGETIVSVDGPPSAVRPGQAEQSASVITESIRDALDAAGMSHVIPKVVCAGVAGVGREAEREALWQALASADIGEEVVVHTDGAIAMDDAFGDGPGMLLIAGTGSIAYGRGPSGEVARCGGWGAVCGDEGGGHWLGRRALSVVTAAADGREPDTALIGAILTAAQVNDVQDLIPWAANATTAQIAALAPTIMQTADAGDLRANALITLAAEELVLHLRTLARTLFSDERATAPAALAGGLLTRGSTLRKRVELRIKSAVPGVQLRGDEVIPARGAVKGALRFLGVGAD